MNFFATILLLGALHGFILTFILNINTKRNIYANRIFSIIISIISVHLVSAYFTTSKQLADIPILIRLIEPLHFLTGPLILAYTNSMISPDWRLKKIHLLHLAPFMLGVIYFIPFYLQPIETKLLFLNNFYSGVILYDYKIIFLLKVVSGFIYLLFSITLLMRHEVRLKDFFSRIDDKNLNWLKNLLIILTITWLLVLTRPLLNFGSTSIFLIGNSVTIIIYIIGYYSLLKETEPNLVSAELKEKKYKKSSISQERINLIRKKIIDLMEKEKVYLNPELNAAQLAEKLNLKPNQLSEILNTGLNQNFYEFINSYRVKETARRLQLGENSNFTILAIAYDSGFSSKSTFYSVFKQHYKKTPVEFLSESKK